MKQLLLFTVLFFMGCAAQTEKGNVLMSNDEQAIREYFKRWMRATKEGELQLARSLIADDAVFLVPGADRMDKERASPPRQLLPIRIPSSSLTARSRKSR